MSDQRPYYRVGNRQPQNVYRHDGPDDETGTFVGVFFTPDTTGVHGDGAHYARLAVQALNALIATGAEHGTPVNAGDDAWNRFVAVAEDNAIESPSEHDFQVEPRYVWLVGSAMEPGSRSHAVPALAIPDSAPTYREILIETLCSPNKPMSLIVTDTGGPEFVKCTRCARALERKQS